MPRDTQTAPVSKKMLWTGRSMRFGCAVPAHGRGYETGQSGSGRGGNDQSVIGIVLLVSVAVFAIPRTSILGAIVLTGYLGGAVASQLRVGLPLFSDVLAPVDIGVAIWGGLFLRDDRLRALIPVGSR